MVPVIVEYWDTKRPSKDDPYYLPTKEIECRLCGVPGGVSGTPRHKINVFSHFGPDLSSPGLTLVPTGIIKSRNWLKKLSKCERRQTNGYRMRFFVNFNQRIVM